VTLHRAIRSNGTPLRTDNFLVSIRTPFFVDAVLNILVEQPSSARAVGCDQLYTVDLRRTSRIYPERGAGALMRGTSARSNQKYRYQLLQLHGVSAYVLLKWSISYYCMPFRFTSYRPCISVLFHSTHFSACLIASLPACFIVLSKALR
jgi:hypothetical protein